MAYRMKTTSSNIWLPNISGNHRKLKRNNKFVKIFIVLNYTEISTFYFSSGFLFLKYKGWRCSSEFFSACKNNRIFLFYLKL